MLMSRSLASSDKDSCDRKATENGQMQEEFSALPHLPKRRTSIFFLESFLPHRVNVSQFIAPGRPFPSLSGPCLLSPLPLPLPKCNHLCRSFQRLSAPALGPFPLDPPSFLLPGSFWKAGLSVPGSCAKPCRVGLTFPGSSGTGALLCGFSQDLGLGEQIQMKRNKSLQWSHASTMFMDTEKGKSVAQMDVLEEMHQEIPTGEQSVTVNAHKYQSYLKKYSYLQMGHKVEFMKQFLLHGQFLGAEELELHADYERQNSTWQLTHFKEQVLNFS
ncbi:uncharacterized protein LOC118985155 [Sturnira hondurensis]|uniref:uncharacterized protein LOC118985155 n=1 Tax=Sturnira hondurensis TaxID=192404 RepID=UPI00187A8B43|nr:uncharacterized protein LOC118985155 [Sturnira hondurensis]